MRCCVGDEGLALRSRPAGGGFKPPHAALAEDRRGERCGKGARRGVRWGPGRRSLLRCRKRRDDIETGAVFRAPGGAWRVAADWPGGVRHEGPASLVCGFCVERGKACPDMAIRPRGGGERERPKRPTPRGTGYRRVARWRTRPV